MKPLPGISRLAVLALLGASLASHADQETLIAGVHMGQSTSDALQAMNAFCADSTIKEYKKPTFPLASENERQVLFTGCADNALGFDTVAMVFADGTLVHLEARGIDASLAAEKSGVADGEYLGMEHRNEGTLWIDHEPNRLVWLSAEALHPNLFAWSSPQLEPRPAAKPSTLPPSIIDFASDLDALLPQFESNCKEVSLLDNERVWLPNAPARQVQIDCFGLPYAGFERKLEAVFGDGKLEVIWVLTGKAEEARLRQQLQADWGAPKLVNENWEVFAEGRISLRKDKPELLILSDEMIPLYSSRFEE